MPGRLDTQRIFLMLPLIYFSITLLSSDFADGKPRPPWKPGAGSCCPVPGSLPRVPGVRDPQTVTPDNRSLTRHQCQASKSTTSPVAHREASAVNCPMLGGRGTQGRGSSEVPIESNQKITTPHGLEVTADTITWFSVSPQGNMTNRGRGKGTAVL